MTHLRNTKTLPVSPIAIGAVLCLCTLILGAVFFMRSPENSAPKQMGEKENLIIPQVVSTDSFRESLTIGQRQQLQRDLTAYIASKRADGTLVDAGIWFRDLNNGPVITINADTSFSPASLLKVPLAIWFYRQASSSPEFLEQEIEFTGPNGTTVQHFPGEEHLVAGRVYTLRELIRILLEESDNDAAAILAQIAGIQNTDTVYADLGIAQATNYSTYVIDVQTYSSFFRMLYNSTYLPRESSQEILTFLSHSSFTAGLVAGVPDTTTVAHKFGERAIDPGQNISQLHDCGIVYVPRQPYILCVMTQGYDYDELAKVIAEVSRRTYDAVTKSD